MTKKLFNLLVIVSMLLVFVPTVATAAPPQVGQDYTVVKDDTLSKLADKYLGNVLSWPAVMALTNGKAAADKTYAKITNADMIEVGMKIYIPDKAEAEKFMATYDPGDPGMLFAAGAKGKLVVGSWWTAGGEAEGLNGLFKIYSQKYPDVEIVNATTAGGSGINFKAQLATRLIGGAPPDTFQLHAGMEVQMYSPEKYLTPVDDVYASEGLEKVFPKDLLTMLKAYGGHYWGIPVNIHRSNVMWYNKAVFDANGLKPPTTFEEFKTVAEAFKAKGIVPFAMGTKEGWEAAHVFEDVLAGTLGAEKYRGLWTGATKWSDPDVTKALENFKMMLSYRNTDSDALTWDGAGQYLIDGKGAMEIMGDWENGWFTSKNFTGYGWAPPPGTKGIFVALSDSFALPAKAPDMDNAKNWLKVSGSKEGQELFNPLKGSICARTDCDPKLFNPYSQSAMVDWSQDAIVPSMHHGAAAIASWVKAYDDTMKLFVTSGDVAATQAALGQACVDAGVCK
jgi:glucose/mannose transport system substrate-binding protein